MAIKMRLGIVLMAVVLGTFISGSVFTVSAQQRARPLSATEAKMLQKLLEDLSKDTTKSVTEREMNLEQIEDFKTAGASASARDSKRNIAVYMAGVEPANVKGALKALGEELAKALTKNGAFSAVKNNVAFPTAGRIIPSSNGQDGAIDIDKVQKTGKQFGAQIMCVAEINEAMESYFLEARLVNVETGEVSSVATVRGNMANASDMAKTAQAAASELVSGKTKSADYTFSEMLTSGKVKVTDYTFREINAKPDKAIADYTIAIRQEPDIAEYYYKRGYAYYEKKDYDKALADFNEAIRRNQNLAEAYNSRGDVYWDKKDYDRAFADYNQAIRMDPNYAVAYKNRGNVYLYGKKDYDNAFADYNQAIRLNPNYAQAYTGRGKVHHLKKDYDNAIIDFSEAIRRNPIYMWAYDNRGDVYWDKKDYDSALADYNNAIRLNPKIARIYNSVGLVYEIKKDYDKAIANFSAALRLNPNYVVVYENRARIYSNKGDYKKAISDLGQAIRLNPKVADTYNSRGIAYQYNKEYNNAIADYNEAIRLDSNFAPAYSNRGYAYASKDAYDIAVADYNKAIRLDPKLASAYGHRGYAYLHQKDYYKAIADFETALRIEPDYSYAKTGLKTAKEETGQFEQFEQFEPELVLTEKEKRLLDGYCEAGRKDVTGIGYGSGYGSGFGDGIDDLLGGLMGGGGGGLDLKKRGELKVSSPDFLKGGRSRASIQRVVMQNMAALRYAYARRLCDKPSLNGKITVKFTINEYGKVILAQVMESTIYDSELESTVVEKVKSWNFDKIDKPGYVTEVVYPFVFSQ